MTNPSGTIQLKKGREKPVLNRHPWLFSGAIQQLQGNPQPGELVDIISAKGEWLSRGYYNPNSQIRARILSWDQDQLIDEAFWQARIEQAINGRTVLQLEPATTAYRLVNAESDNLPGLVVDKYGDNIVVQCLTLGIDTRKEMLIDIVERLLKPKAIIERSDVSVREKEGLTEIAAVRRGKGLAGELTILENNHKFAVNLLEGHKTGLYLDQRDNRAAVCRREHAAGKEILNLFAYTGGFALYAAAQGAGNIINVDSSADLLTQAEKNLQLNGFERPQDEYIVADVFQLLRHYRDNGRTFDVIILDPPKFAHSRRDINSATRGYKDLNWLAMRLLNPGGLLATFSCSGLISMDLFQKVLFGAAVDAGREVQIIQILSQSADHPILLTFPESAYLKGFLCRVW
jgi:23S rRNA (cytosine1962-C5)-methyltransferase